MSYLLLADSLLARISAVTMMLSSRLPRHIPHILENPSVMIRVPLFLLFLYANSVMKIYALFTLNNVSRLTRTVILMDVLI